MNCLLGRKICMEFCLTIPPSPPTPPHTPQKKKKMFVRGYCFQVIHMSVHHVLVYPAGVGGGSNKHCLFLFSLKNLECFLLQFAQHYSHRIWITCITLRANSADEKLIIYFFPENKTWHFMKCQILFSEKNKKNISVCHLLKILPSMLSMKQLCTSVYT